jgi:hypothetical protein
MQVLKQPRKALNHFLGFVIIAEAIAVAVIAAPWGAGDSSSYLELATNLGRGFYGHITPTGIEADALRPPGYPLVLALLWKVLALPLGLIIAIQIGLYLATIMILDRFCARQGIDTTIFRLLVAIYPFAAAYSAYIMTEAWTMFLFTASLLLAFERETRVRNLILSGSLAGVAALFRTDLLLLSASIFVVLALRYWKQREHRNLARALIVPMVACLVLFPYAAWNLQYFGKFSPTPMAAAFGNSFYMAYWQDRLDLSDTYAFYNDGRVTPRIRDTGYLADVQRVNTSVGAPLNSPPDNPIRHQSAELQIATSKAFGAAAIDHFWNDPVPHIRRTLKNVVLLWNATDAIEDLPGVVRIPLLISSFAISFLGMLGMSLIAVRILDRPVMRAMILPFLLPYILHLPVHLEARYTATLRPMLLMFAAVALTWIGARLFPRLIPHSAKLEFDRNDGSR